MTSVHFEREDLTQNMQDESSGCEKANNVSPRINDGLFSNFQNMLDVQFDELRSKYQTLPHVGCHIIAQTTDKNKKHSVAFCLSLRSLEGIAAYLNLGNEVHAEYQISVSLFDLKFKCFFGKQWIGPSLPCGQSKKINYKQNVYFHTAFKNPNVLGVVEIIVHTADEVGKVRRLSCGWGVIHLFKYNEDLPDSSRGLPLPLQTSVMYHGSPRALFFLDDPVEENSQLKRIQDCQLNYTICTHKILMQVMHLIPENVIVGSQDVIPGLVDGRDAGKDKFKKPKLLNQVSVQMEHFSLHLQPYVDKFEEELCTLLKEDRANRENRTIEGTQVSIVERRLQIGVHNGLCYVEKPQTVLLEEKSDQTSKKPTASPSVRRSTKFTHKRTGSTGSASSQSTNLVLKNPVQINDLLQDPMFAVILKLEYVVAEPLSDTDRKISLSYARAHTRTVSLRWAVWNPFLHPNQHEIHVGLIGGTKQSPDEDFIYKVPDTVMQDETVGKTAGGLAMFQWSMDGKIRDGMPSMSYNQMSGLSNGYANGLSPHTDVYGATGSMTSVRSEGNDSLVCESSASRRPPSGKQKMPSSPHYAASLQVPQHQQAVHGIMPSQHATAYTQPGMYGAPPVYPQMYMPMAPSQPIYQANMMQMAQMPETEMREMPYQPTHAPTLTPIPLPVGGQGLSRAAYARLYSAGFALVLDRNGEPPEVIDPQSRVHINLAREHADPLQCNEIIFQFLAFSKMLVMDTNGPKKNAGSVFFTFQFYRFPQMTTERMLLGQPQNDLTSNPQSLPFILQRLEKDGTTIQTAPGYEVKYLVDPAFLKPGEGYLFLQHLSRQILHIDVWDGDSLLQIGFCRVDLKYLCRSGHEAVQTTFELDVMKIDYPDEMSTVSSDDKTGIQAQGSHSVLQGKLHLRMANIGHLLDSKATKADISPLPSKTQVIVSQTAGNSKYKGGSLTNTANVILGTKKLMKKSRAHHLSENREVATLLFSDKTTTPSHDEDEVTREGDAEKQRKLSRMQAIRQMTSNNEKQTTVLGYRKEKSERMRDLKTIEIYRLQTKRDGIINMLNESITSEHTIFPSFGTTEFFEFVFRNPFNVEQTITVECSDPDIQVVTNAREWRHFKTLGQLPTQLEENMFSKDSKTDMPQLFLRAKETVNIPLRFRSFITDQSVQPQGPVDPLQRKQSNFKTGDQQLEDVMQSKIIKVYFKSEENKPIAILSVKVEPQPHVMDQTFRFYHPERSFLKKAIRLPPFHSLPGNPVGGSGVNKVYVRCSDDNVITDSKATQPGEPHDIFFKVALGPSPQRKRFFISIYVDPFLSRPIQIWQIYVHALQRVDLACVEGQTSRFSLLLKGTQASRLVRCYSSNEVEMQLSPNDQFMLAAGAVHELNVAVRSNQVGNISYYINVVDVEYHQLVRSWLVCVNCRAPIVSRAYDLILPVGGGKGSSKKITYTNPYPNKKSFVLKCDRGELLQFKESCMEIDGGGTYPIGLRFVPVMQPGSVEILVFVNDEEDKNEETFKITATYRYVET